MNLKKAAHENGTVSHRVADGAARQATPSPPRRLWQLRHRAAATGLISNTKLNRPLFRQFGVRAIVSASDTIQYGSAGENVVTTNPTRVFPDLPQILSNNTNAATGSCPTAAATPTAADIECYSEYLPTATYLGFAGTNAAPAALNFRLTARDGHGGNGSAPVQLLLASAP
ncbi:MAG: hypothetical protein JWR40_3747, partial [Massilia sp.]|nr:hypothetical protein [Massilia sp.]